MTDPGLAPVRVWRADSPERDLLAVEEPLAITLDGHDHAVLMRTPGEDLDLVAGFLATEGVIEDRDDLAAMAPCATSENKVNVLLATGVTRPAPIERPAYAGCGVCGRRSIDEVLAVAEPVAPVDLPAEVITALPDLLDLPRFEATGGLHGAALCTSTGDLLLAREDVGRHNAVDKVIGAALRADDWPLEGKVLVVSSRAGFEIVHKALMARVGAVVCVGAASSLAHDLAQAGRLALYSFVRAGRFNAHQP